MWTVNGAETMRNQLALALALPLSILLNAGLFSGQSYQATPLETKPDLQIASLSVGPISTFLSPLHPSTPASVSRPSLSVPKLTVPSASRPTLTAPNVTFPIQSRQSLPAEQVTVPSLSRPAASVPQAIGGINILPPLPPLPAITAPPHKNKLPKRGPKAPVPPKKSKTGDTKKPKKRIRIITTALRPAVEVDESVKYVALTFDDGPSPEYTPKVLAILKKEGIHATFCLIGRQVKKYPELVQQIVADGHKIADHSMNHDLCLQKRSDKKIKQEIIDTKTLIESIVPGTPVDYFRAPGGNFDRHMKEMVDSWGMQSLGWSVDTKDWQRPGVDQILATIQAQLKPGGVILMHDAGGDRSETVEALEKVIPQLREEGYKFVFPG